MPQFRTLLKNRNFVLYSVGQAFSQFGDRLVQIVLIGFVYKRWPGSTFQLAKLFFFTVLPSFLISPIAGVYIDRWNKRYVMIASDIIRALMILCIPLFFIYRESIIPIYISIFFIFTAACFFLPARLSVIPRLVSKEDILLANSASSIIWVAAGLAGFSFGGILTESIGIKSSLYLNALVYMLSAMSFVALVYSMRSKDKAPQPERLSFSYDFIKGLKTLFLDTKMRSVACVFFILASTFGAIYVVGVVFIQETLGTMTRDVGIFGMCLFAGLMISSYIYGKIGKRLNRTKTIFISLLLAGILINIFAVGLKVMGSFWAGSISAFLLGAFMSPVYVTAYTIVHELIESDLRGRIFSSIGIIINLGFLLFMLLSSILAEHIGRFWILVICGIGLVLFGIIAMLAGFLKELNFSSS